MAGDFLGRHNSPPFPLPPSFPSLTPIHVPCGHQGQPGSLAGSGQGGQGRWPCWEPCPREDVTTCLWCALASGSINALLAAARAAQLDTDVGTDTWTRIRVRTDTCTSHTHRGTLAQPPHPPCAGDTLHQLHFTPVSQTGGIGGQMSHAGETNQPRQGQMLCGGEGEQGSPGLWGAGEAAASRLIANYPRYSVSDTL